MLEVEVKFPVADQDSLLIRLQTLSAHWHEVRHEEDQYFNAPDRDFAQTDEALRLRQVGAANVLTYKGPKLDAATKTRTEIEVPLADGPEAADKLGDLLVKLGYRPTAVVCKERTVYSLTVQRFPVEVCVDAVEGVGLYVEIEIVAPDDQADAARSIVLDLAAKLGLGGSERRSYLEMWLAKHREQA